MSTVVPRKGGGYRLFTKGASEIVLKKLVLFKYSLFIKTNLNSIIKYYKYFKLPKEIKLNCSITRYVRKVGQAKSLKL